MAVANQKFSNRHIGPKQQDQQYMLEILGFSSMADFLDAVVPKDIRLRDTMALPPALSESQALAELKALADLNRPYRSLIGQGYYGTFVPAVIQRNVLENPAWYTAYTPYQPEISQGRLEALLNFQTMVSDLTSMDIANASLLDEATAAAEAMMLARRQSKVKSSTFLVDRYVYPQTLDVIRTRAQYHDIDVVVADLSHLDNQDTLRQDAFGVLLQYPCSYGGIRDYTQFVRQAHEYGQVVCMATDLLALTLITPPGEFGVDIVIGNSQRFGVPLGYGGPHAAFMAVRDSFKRTMPGRLVGVSKDSRGKIAYRLALQTREQHIRREKATSNICTAQALLAVMAGSYAIYHGPRGLKAIAERVYQFTSRVAKTLAQAGLHPIHQDFFDTLSYRFADKQTADKVMERALTHHINLRRIDQTTVGFSFDECTTEAEAELVVNIISGESLVLAETAEPLSTVLLRQSEYLTHPVFHRYQSETEMMRYLRRLADYDLALDRTMIPLGSCTMKLNAAAELQGLSWSGFTDIHPFAPVEQAQGYQQLFKQLREMLAVVTGYDAVSLQPNSGAQGEFAGLLTIRAYHQSQGEGHRNVCLIPSSAHGTNPASAALAGMKVVIVACDKNGNIDLQDFASKTQEYEQELAAVMVTYPSTHGVFEKTIRKICELTHQAGGQVYLDGANFNALVGLSAPGKFGSDVSHLNLHKTFAIPHGGGGPGVGPIGVGKHLQSYLPSHNVFAVEGKREGGAVSAAPWGSALIDSIAWMYLRMMGSDGLKQASLVAILNANYIAHRLSEDYEILYKDEHGRVAHECILDLRNIKEEVGISVDDVAKRLMDYGFHAPTMSFPVAGTLMIEPTESEPLTELDRFCEAMKQIAVEIQKVRTGEWPLEDNPLVNAPHTLADLVDARWSHAYSRQQAIYPLPGMNAAKYFTPVNRIDNVYGDRHVMCVCPPIENYQDD